jgi:hypothetical protein
MSNVLGFFVSSSKTPCGLTSNAVFGGILESEILTEKSQYKPLLHISLNNEHATLFKKAVHPNALKQTKLHRSLNVSKDCNCMKHLVIRTPGASKVLGIACL